MATLAVGIIAYKQSKYYQSLADQKEKFVDVVAERVEIVNYTIASNKMGRKCVPKDTTLFGRDRFLITLFSYVEIQFLM